jgi:hypothetical protein
MLLIAVRSERVRFALGMLAVHWGYVVRLACSRADAIAAMQAQPICAAIVQAALSDGSGLEIVERLARVEPFAPPVLALLKRGEGDDALESFDIPFLHCAPDSEMVRLWLVHHEQRALRCALAAHARRQGLTAREAELFAYEGTGLHGAALQEAMRAAPSTLSELRRRMRPKLGEAMQQAVARASATFKQPV